MDPLAGLDAVPWVELHDAYGSAEEVPELLRAMQRPEDRDAALYTLHETIWHQGTVYEATAPAVPFLAGLAEADESLMADMLALLALIAQGSIYSHGPGVDPRSPEQIDRETDWVLRAREAVRAELPRLVELTRARVTQPVLAAFSWLAYGFPEERNVFYDTLDEAFQSLQATPLDQAAVVMALLRSGDDEGRADDVFISALASAMKHEEADRAARDPARLTRLSAHLVKAPGATLSAGYSVLRRARRR